MRNRDDSLLRTPRIAAKTRPDEWELSTLRAGTCRTAVVHSPLPLARHGAERDQDAPQISGRARRELWGGQFTSGYPYRSRGRAHRGTAESGEPAPGAARQMQ